MPVAFALAFFHGCDDFLTVPAEVAEFVEFSVVAASDDSGVSRESGRFIGNGAFETFTDVSKLINLAVQADEAARCRRPGVG